jgi:hypothetical protein
MRVAIAHLEQTIAGTLPPRKMRLCQHVRAEIRKRGDKEFSVPSIYEALVADGVAFRSKQPKTRMDGFFWKMSKAGAIKRVFEGIGQIPHRYVATPKFRELWPDDHASSKLH